MFGIEVLVYLYIAICVSMIAFNIAALFRGRRRSRVQGKRSARLLEDMRARLSALEHDAEMSEREWNRMVRRLSRVDRLMAFDDAVETLAQEDAAGAARFLHFCAPAMAGLCFSYRKKPAMQQAYLAYLLGKYEQARFLKLDAAAKFCRMLLASDNLYCRENAMRAFYSYGSVRMMAEAIHMLDQNPGFYHGKLLTDGLLTFRGDHRRLIDTLWAQMDRLQDHTRLAILNYIRFCCGGYEARMLELLLDPPRDIEQHYAAIRYLGRYPYAPACETLIYLATRMEPEQWSAAAISATALAAYPGAATVSALKQALHHSNWYVRYNAAQSLERLNVSYLELSDILTGPDRYAREMLQFRIEERARRQKEAAARAAAQQKEAAVCLT